MKNKIYSLIICLLGICMLLAYKHKEKYILKQNLESWRIEDWDNKKEPKVEDKPKQEKPKNPPKKSPG